MATPNQIPWDTLPFADYNAAPDEQAGGGSSAAGDSNQDTQELGGQDTPALFSGDDLDAAFESTADQFPEVQMDSTPATDANTNMLVDIEDPSPMSPIPESESISRPVSPCPDSVEDTTVNEPASEQTDELEPSDATTGTVDKVVHSSKPLAENHIADSTSPSKGSVDKEAADFTLDITELMDAVTWLSTPVALKFITISTSSTKTYVEQETADVVSDAKEAADTMVRPSTPLVQKSVDDFMPSPNGSHEQEVTDGPTSVSTSSLQEPVVLSSSSKDPIKQDLILTRDDTPVSEKSIDDPSPPPKVSEQEMTEGPNSVSMSPIQEPVALSSLSEAPIEQGPVLAEDTTLVKSNALKESSVRDTSGVPEDIETPSLKAPVEQDPAPTKDTPGESNTPKGSSAFDTSDVPEGTGTPTRGSKPGSQLRINTLFLPQGSSEDFPVQNTTPMAGRNWMRQLKDDTPDYDGQWEDTPSRTTSFSLKKTFDKNSFDNGALRVPLLLGEGLWDDQLSQAGSSSCTPVAPTPEALKKELDDGFEDVNLNSPVKSTVRKPAVLRDAFEAALERNLAQVNSRDNLTTVEEFEDVDLNAPDQELNSPSLVGEAAVEVSDVDEESSQEEDSDSASEMPVTPIMRKAPKSTPGYGKGAMVHAPKLQTPGTVSPMPTFTEVETETTGGSPSTTPKLRTPTPMSPLPDFTENILDDSDGSRPASRLRRTMKESSRPGSPSAAPPRRMNESPSSARRISMPSRYEETVSGGEYEDMGHDVLYHQMQHEGEFPGSGKLPEYHYPGTFDAAKKETYEAAKNLGAAAATFGSSIAKSGIGKAAWSMGAVAGDGVRRAGKHVTTQAILNSGYKESLPCAVQEWTDKNEKKRIWKADKKARMANYKLADTKNGSAGSSTPVSENTDVGQGKDSWDGLEEYETEGFDPAASGVNPFANQPPPKSAYETGMEVLESGASGVLGWAKRANKFAAKAKKQLKKSPPTYGGTHIV